MVKLREDRVFAASLPLHKVKADLVLFGNDGDYSPGWKNTMLVLARQTWAEMGEPVEIQIAVKGPRKI
jgi:hypothetical protein